VFFSETEKTDKISSNFFSERNDRGALNSTFYHQLFVGESWQPDKNMAFEFGLLHFLQTDSFPIRVEFSMY
jgi:hypothetical protein